MISHGECLKQVQLTFWFPMWHIPECKNISTTIKIAWLSSAHFGLLLTSYICSYPGYLCSSVTEQTGRAGTLVYKQDDMVTKSAVVEAVEAFLSRSQADIGQSLPLHVEGSLYYLQDHLLDVCQCWIKENNSLLLFFLEWFINHYNKLIFNICLFLSMSWLIQSL